MAHKVPPLKSPSHLENLSFAVDVEDPNFDATEGNHAAIASEKTKQPHVLISAPMSTSAARQKTGCCIWKHW